jgi:hypothetical protein
VSDGLEGVIAMLLRVGLTKNPLHATIKADRSRIPKDPAILIFCFELNILDKFQPSSETPG